MPLSYVAICKPLHYTTIMSRELPPACALCMAGQVSDHFFAPYASPPAGLVCSLIILCDYFPLLQLSCSDTWLLEVMGFYFALVSLLFMALVILSYMYVIRTILRILSASQRKKAFSTSSSHMTVISISDGSCMFMYANPSSKKKHH